MRTEINVVYEDEDFEKVEREMTVKRAAEVLQNLPRGYFPYRKPSWGVECDEWDLEHYEICLALDKAIECLKLVSDTEDALTVGKLCFQQ